MREEEIEKLRGVVRDCVSKHLYSSAIFFADKVAALTNDPADIYMQAQALFLGRHFRRAFHLLNASKIVLTDLRFRYLAAKCLEELNDWDQCLSMLNLPHHHTNTSLIYLDKDAAAAEINISSAICFLRAKAYEALENRAQARLWYIAAVKADPLCYEALECLIEKHMLTCDEEATLLSSLQFGPEDGWLSSFYSCLTKKHDKESVVEAKFRELEKESCISDSSDSSITQTLKTNTDLLACKAEYYHQCGEYQKCFELTSVLLEKDPFHLKSTLVHLVAAMELGNSNELYLMACNLVKDYPQKALSWFAVGCYYYCIKKYDQSHRYFRCHLPTLYIGMEYMRTHSFKLAEQFFMQAKTICPSDPLVYNELGVVAYHMKDKLHARKCHWSQSSLAKGYNKAALWFEKTLAHIPSPLSELWEPTVVNLAHAYRKLKMYHEAISHYEKALALSTRSVSTYAGLAYTYHLQDDFTAAITYYHKALWLKPDDQFCTEMLSVALVDECRRGVDPKIEFRRSEVFV
ncbi:anaphase-promoting complex subunit 6 isoform X3 [Quercus suber]|uniref:anaphase-promoting complex subunit 6 isoform X3 n=1 Tax=Quercus suber TaxID=58331 RepID=UPI0032DE9055